MNKSNRNSAIADWLWALCGLFWIWLFIWLLPDVAGLKNIFEKTAGTLNGG